MTRILLRREDTETKAHGEECCMKTEAKSRMMQLQAKECQGFPGATRGWIEARKNPSLEPSCGAQSWPMPCLVARTERK